MNLKILVFVICVEMIIYLLCHLHNCTFKVIYFYLLKYIISVSNAVSVLLDQNFGLSKFKKSFYFLETIWITIYFIDISICSFQFQSLIQKAKPEARFLALHFIGMSFFVVGIIILYEEKYYQLHSMKKWLLKNVNFSKQLSEVFYKKASGLQLN